MGDSMTLKEAQNRIKELESEVKTLKELLQKYENKSLGGRHKHDDKWQQGFDVWVNLHEGGYAIAEVMDKMEISRRTYYRYKEYYQSLKEN